MLDLRGFGTGNAFVYTLAPRMCGCVCLCLDDSHDYCGCGVMKLEEVVRYAPKLVEVLFILKGEIHCCEEARKICMFGGY